MVSNQQLAVSGSRSTMAKLVVTGQNVCQLIDQLIDYSEIILNHMPPVAKAAQ
jgi:hypothetical protein